MKLHKFANLLVLGLVATIALSVSGCRKKPGYITPIPGTKPGVVGDGTLSPGLGATNTSGLTGDQIRDSGIPTVDPKQFENYNAHPEILKNETVYFDFDSSAIKASEQSKLEKVADYLKANTGHALRIEGNCDERGTEEYNRSLGERRAVAAREELARLGADPNRILTVSYGEDRPAEVGQDEAAYRKNRRDEFIVLTPPGQ